MNSRLWFAPLLGAALGTLVFLCTFGVQVIVPTNTDWLLTGGDLSQHYIGWEFFRQSDWTFPIGVAGDLAYPHGLAITFMDSLPLFAIPAKLFGGILPEQFQYFGLWGLMSYMAVGGFAALIARRLTGNPWVVGLVALLLCFSPLIFQRMFTHTALAGQWILLAGVYTTMLSREWQSRKNMLVWSALLSVAVLIHPYFLPMMVFVLAVSVIVRHKTYLQSCAAFFVPVAAAILTTWLIGGFTFTTISGQKFGGAGYDLAAPFLASGWSVVGLGMPQLKFETVAYIGLGGLLIIIAALCYVYLRRKTIVRMALPHRAKIIALAAVTVVFLAIAIGPTIKVGGVQFFAYEVPTVVEKVWGIFRVTARLAWPLLYAVLVLAIAIVVRFAKPRTALIIVATACMLQVIDVGLSPRLAAHTQKFHDVQAARYSSQLTDPAWRQILQGKRHVVYLGDLYDDKFVNLAQFCLQHDLTLNTGYFARKPTVAIERTIQDAKHDIANGSIKSDTIYLYEQPISSVAQEAQRKLNGFFVIVR